MQQYVDKGFVPEPTKKGPHAEGCAMTLYFAYEDWCMAPVSYTHLLLEGGVPVGGVVGK